MIRKVATGLLAAVILSTATGCMPSPFEQDIPSTSWQVDEKGNRIKVTNPGGGVTAEDVAVDKKAVKDTLENYYASLTDEEVVAALKKTMESGQSMKLSEDPAERKKQEEELAKQALPSVEPVLANIDTTGLTDIESATLAMSSVFVGGMGLSQTETKVPDDIVIISGETATIDLSKAEVYFQGEKTETVAAADGKSIVHFVKKDGEWKLNGKKLAESMGIDGSSANISISGGS